MANYKNKKYKNSLAEFKKWCKDFPGVGHAPKAQFKNGDYYLELSVDDYSTGAYVVETLRQYDEEEQNFELIDDILQKYDIVVKYFGKEAKSFASKNKATLNPLNYKGKLK